MSDVVDFRLSPAQHIQSSYSLFFSQKSRVGTLAPALNSVFEPLYHPAQEIDVPAGADANFPRLIFVSQHGFSHIVVSVNSIALNVRYSPEWQYDFAKGLGYLRERVPLLVQAMGVLGSPLLYMGMGTTSHFSIEDEGTLVRNLARTFGGILAGGDPHELSIRVSNVIDGLYFNNIALSNYRTWPVSPIQSGGLRLDRDSATERGLQVEVDFNDRFAFNEVVGYRSDPSSWVNVVEKFESTYTKLLNQLESGKW